MNKKNLDKIIEQYVANFDFLNRSEAEGGHDEGYKWRVISSFKRHWDIEAKDFASMLQKSMAELSKTNLVNNASIQPVTGLINLAKVEGEGEFLRGEFRELFKDDGGDLEDRGERVNSFMETVDKRIDEKLNGSWKAHQPRNAVIFYLNLWRPEDNYLFKATQAREWADCVEFADDFGAGDNFSLEKYYKMCDELRNALEDYPEVLKLNKERVAKEAVGFDDNNHLLTFDIIYCSHDMSFYRECPTLGVSTKERIRIARRREQEEAIENEIQAKADQIEALEKQIKPIPNLIGKTVNHKLRGKGVVIGHDDKRITVKIESKEIKFSEDAVIKGLLKVDDWNDSILLNNDRLGKEIRELEKSIDSLIRDKDKLV